MTIASQWVKLAAYHDTSALRSHPQSATLGNAYNESLRVRLDNGRTGLVSLSLTSRPKWVLLARIDSTGGDIISDMDRVVAIKNPKNNKYEPIP